MSDGQKGLQALRNHLDNVRRNDARQQHQITDVDDEKLKEIGKSNLDKWLQLLLFKDVESAGSSPGRDTPLQIVSPALPHISVAAMRESLERASHQVPSLKPPVETPLKIEH